MTGIESVPQILQVIVTECNDDVCIVNVMWSEAFISCSGSVSQYVLSVTPPTSDCQSSSEDCVLMTHHTHYDLTLTVNETYILTVRADTCSNTLTGNYSDNVSIRVNGMLWLCRAMHCIMAKHSENQSLSCILDV